MSVLARVSRHFDYHASLQLNSNIYRIITISIIQLLFLYEPIFNAKIVTFQMIACLSNVYD